MPYSGATTPVQSGLRATVINEYSTFSKAPALLGPHNLIVLFHILDTRSGVESYQSTGMQSSFSAVPVDLIVFERNRKTFD